MARPGAGEAVRPNVVVSQCLGFAAVRYNGQILTSRFVEALRDHVDFIQVCPEVGIGLGVPRDPVHIVEGPSGQRLIQPDTGRDVTEEMHEFSDRFLGGMGEADGFILKARSPSCGLTDTKIFGADAGSGPHRRGSGLFAAAVTEAFPWAAVQDEGRLTNLRLRHHFLIHLWTLARLRAVRASESTERLVRFHASHEFILMMFGPDVLSRLGRIVENPDRRGVSELVLEYRAELGRALTDPPQAANVISALQQVFGCISEFLDDQERAYFLELLEEFRAGRLTLPVISAGLRSWVVRFAEEYPAVQHFLRPYPRALLDLHGSGDGPVV